MSSEPNHILVVEPEVGLRDQLRALLASGGYDVALAFSLDEVLTLARRGGIDVCLLGLDLGVDAGCRHAYSGNGELLILVSG